MGKRHFEVDESFLSVPVSERFQRYRIFHHLCGEDRLEVVRILHGARDFGTIFRTKP